MKHGDYSTYINHSCRCVPCRDSATQRVREQRARRKKQRVEVNGRLVSIAPNVYHGSASTYSNWSCRCEPCTIAHTTWTRHYRGHDVEVPPRDVDVRRGEPRREEVT